MHSALEHNSQSRPTAVRQFTGSGERLIAVPYVGYEHRTVRSENTLPNYVLTWDCTFRYPRSLACTADTLH